MILSCYGHKPTELGGYGRDNFAKVVGFAVETIPQFEPTKIISGLSLGWEQAVAMAAIELGLPLIAALPFEGQETIWPDHSKSLYEKILENATEVKFLSEGRFTPFKYQYRNEWVVENSEGVLVLWNTSGTLGIEADNMLAFRKQQTFLQEILDHADKRDKSVYQLWSHWLEWNQTLEFQDFRSSILNMCGDDL